MRAASLFTASMFAILSCASFTLPIEAQDKVLQPRKVAMLIGNSSYEKNPLVSPANDVKQIGVALEEIGFEVTSKLNRNQQQLESDFGEFLQGLHAGDVCLVFFAGHGLQIEGRNYLMPLQTNMTEPKHAAEQCISARSIIKQMEDSGASLKVLLWDCCRNNPLENHGGKAKSVVNEEKTWSKTPAPEGMMIAYATSDEKVALGGVSADKMSAFTTGLVTTLRSDHPTGLEVIDWISLASRSAKEETGQTPRLYSDPAMDPYFIKRTGVSLIDDENVTGELQVTIKTEGNQTEFQEGETFRCEITANQDCYVTLLGVNPDGEIVRLAPNKFHEHGLELKSGQTVAFPTHEMDIEFTASPPHGKTILRAIATQHRLQIKFEPDPNESAEDTGGIVVLGTVKGMQSKGIKFRKKKNNPTVTPAENSPSKQNPSVIVYDPTIELLRAQFEPNAWGTSTFFIESFAK